MRQPYSTMPKAKGGWKKKVATLSDTDDPAPYPAPATAPATATAPTDRLLSTI